MQLFEMSCDALDRAVERYYDKLYDDYIGREDAWDSTRHDWTDVYGLIDESKSAAYMPAGPKPITTGLCASFVVPI